jgi:hypothetical protein
MMFAAHASVGPHLGAHQQFPQGSRLERDPVRLNRCAPLTFCLRMIFSENRFPLFGIMRSVRDCLLLSQREADERCSELTVAQYANFGVKRTRWNVRSPVASGCKRTLAEPCRELD